LNGWRGPYMGDVLSWHDRAKTHFKAYALSQVKSPLTGPVVMDTALNLARSLEKMGTSVFSSGYISRNPNGDFRPHHYNMNLVYIDGLVRHFKWTGDWAFAKKMWPVITRHLAWEKRNFDSDDDGLYDAYAAIWASDALQYSGGSVTHSSAYNYYANKEIAVLAKLIGEDATPFEKEAAKILKAINAVLWMPLVGSYAEFKDLLGNKLIHPNAALWTIYNSLDSDVPNPFQAYQAMKYIDNNIPHIPVRAKGLEEGYSTISTSKWMPYDWSLNNVATAEVMHTALAYWQAGRNDKGFNLFKSELLSTMYLGGSAGNIGQISFYDAARGEAYRDFADPVAMTARSLVEGLFGIQPNALQNELVIKPGFPSHWNTAAITLPDVSIDFKRKNKEDIYTIIPAFFKKMPLKLVVKANGAAIKSVIVNGKKVSWQNVADAIGTP
ncbi:MAG: glycogen debranching protein, partial [Sphingobacteriales bacterium]